MPKKSKNARTGTAEVKNLCNTCGGEVKMQSLFEKGKLRHFAECEKCSRKERRPKDFK